MSAADAGGLLGGRVAVVTGGARGIGAAVGRAFVAAGAAVVVADVDADAASAEARRLVAAGGRALAATVDVTAEGSLEALADTVQEGFGRIDVVVANAGVIHLAPLVELEPADFARVLAVNLTGTYLTLRTFARRLIAQGDGGSLIVSSSLFGRRGGRENVAYSASKFGTIGVMESAAADLAEHDIVVNAVCAGQVDSEMLDRFTAQRAGLTGSDPAALKRAMVERIPLRRLASVEELADVYVFLASPMARYVTGQSLVVDGGMQVA